jgi:hypothetical protein
MHGETLLHEGAAAKHLHHDHPLGGVRPVLERPLSRNPEFNHVA